MTDIVVTRADGECLLFCMPDAHLRFGGEHPPRLCGRVGARRMACFIRGRLLHSTGQNDSRASGAVLERAVADLRRCVIYARVSTRHQSATGYGLDA